jgi:hypothetical protein
MKLHNPTIVGGITFPDATVQTTAYIPPSSGFSGYSGFSGQSGFSGYSGTGSSGFSGYSGPQGPSGFSGIDGVIGGSGFSGYSGTTGSSGFSGYSGTQGASGFSGYSGVTGNSGFSGYSGPQGTTGTSGFSGYSGTTGVSGFSGYSSASGFSGYSGVTGNSGFSGYSGTTGASGFSGYSSASGFSGYSGLQGTTGTSGFSGYSGTTGASGFSGYSSASGFSGYSADSGFSGYSGFSGKSGFSGYSSASGFSGYSGPQGTSGFSGYSGTTGASGFSGYSGVTGASGFSGYSGTTGASGFSGYSSASGFSGYSGTTGSSGFSGYSGPQGTSGFSGYSSASGFSGYSGPQGTTGTSGFSGYSGPQGNSGFSGYSGVTGASGFSGYSGTTGTSGFSGYSSASGFSGYSGPQGTSGFSGYSSSSGFSGYCGASGFSGYSGPQGTSGFSGYSSASGFSGYSGFSSSSGFSGYSSASGFSGYSGTTGASGFSGYSGSTGVSGFSGYSGVGSSGFSGYSGAVTDATFVPLGTPTDGLWTDGLNAWTSVTTVADALDDCNELFSYLAPADASALSGNLTMAGTTLFTGYVSSGNTNYKTGLPAGSSYAYIINDPTFTLTNPNIATSFNKADDGYTRWYSAVGTAAYSTYISQVDHVANFVSGSRSGSQATVPWTSGQLSVTLVSWYNSFPKWQRGNAVITITAGQLSQGYNRIKMQREGSFTTQASNDYEVFYDNDAGANPSISGTPTVTEGGTVNTRQLSGVKFYDRGTIFVVSCVGLDCFDNTYVLNPLALTSTASNCMGNASIPWNDATVSGVSNPPAIGETMTVTNKQITVPASNVRSMDARVTVTPSDPYASYSAVQTAAANRLVDGYLNTAAGTSSDTGEFFDDEWYRMLSNFSLTSTSYSSGGAGGWDSTISLVSGTTGYTGLQVYNGGLKYPVTNYTSGYLPSTGQVNYSSASGNRTYIRYFYVGGGIQTLTFTLANQSGTTNFVSVATGPSSTNLTMELLAPNTTVNGSSTVEFKDCYVAYTTDTAIGCYASGTRGSTTSNWACSLGTKSTSTSGNVIVVRITAAAAWTGVLETLSVVAS